VLGRRPTARRTWLPAISGSPEVQSTPGRVKVVFKWNPADAGSLLIWNRGAEPKPRYVALPNADQDFFDGLSFWHWEKIREFAEKRDLEYSSEAGRWARNDLRKRWESFSGKLPLRETTDERRGLAFSQGTFDDSTRNERVDVDESTIIETEAESSTDGRNEPDGVSDEVYAAMIDGDDGKIKGRKPSERTIRRGRATKARHEREAEEAERKREIREWIDAATGAPDESARDTMVLDDDLPRGEEWGDQVPIDNEKDVPLAEDSEPDDLPRGEDWGDAE
jgi:putative transposase